MEGFPETTTDRIQILEKQVTTQLYKSLYGHII